MVGIRSLVIGKENLVTGVSNLVVGKENLVVGKRFWELKNGKVHELHELARMDLVEEGEERMIVMSF